MKIIHTFRPVYVPVINFIGKKIKKPKRYHHLFDEIRRNKAGVILEVGTWNGKRAIEMIKEAQKHTDKKIEYIGFDLFEDLTDDMYIYELSKKPPKMTEVKAELEVTGADITLIKGNTLETLPEYIKDKNKVDFIFIDGGHNAETVKSDWTAVSKLMHKDTVVIFDDYWRNRRHESAGPAVDEIDRSRYNVKILPEIDCFTNPDFGRLEISFVKVVLK